MPDGLTDRQRRLLDAVLVLGVIALAFIVLGFAGSVFYVFGDVLLLFFLAWLLLFRAAAAHQRRRAADPKITRRARSYRVPRNVIVLLAILVQASAMLASSINQFIVDAPNLEDQLTNVLAELQSRLAGFGFTVDLVSQAPEVVANLQQWAGELVGPLQSLAFASIGVFGNILILVILSIYIAVDREEIVAFLYRLVPPATSPRHGCCRSSVSRSFGGFLRGQVVLGLVFGLFTAIVNIVFGLPYAAVTTAAAGLLQMIPFFGPFVSWLPPVVIALLLKPDATLPVLILMGIAWFVTMTVISPRLMSGAVGIHPIVVLASVVIGSKIAGIVGAIFGIPIAAVLSAFFFHWYGRSRRPAPSQTGRRSGSRSARAGRSGGRENPFRASTRTSRRSGQVARRSGSAAARQRGGEGAG